MKKRSAGIILAVLISSIAFASNAAAAVTVSSEVTVQPQGTLFKEVARPVNVSVHVDVVPGVGDLTLIPLMATQLNVSRDLAFLPKKGFPVCTAVNANDANYPPDSAKAKCPDSVIGDGTASLYLAGNTALRTDDPVITIFNGGTDSSGGGILAIHAYSASTNHGIFMSGSIKNGELNVAIPRLTADSAVPTFTLNIPGDIGMDRNYAQSTCSSGSWTMNADLTLGNRSDTGVVSNEQTLATQASTVPCVGKAGNASFSRLAIKGPKRVRKGRKGTFKVKVTNRGTATAKRVKVAVRGKGVRGSRSAGAIAPGKSRTVKVKVKFTRKGNAKATFRATARGTKAKTGSRRVRVR